jgi:hypothetical protein
MGRHGLPEQWLQKRDHDHETGGTMDPLTGRTVTGGAAVECALGEGEVCTLCVGVDPLNPTLPWSLHLWHPVDVDACRGLLDPVILAPSFLGRLCGTIVDEASNPLGGSRICVHRDDEQGDCTATTYTASDESWTIRALINGTYTMSATHPSYADVTAVLLCI